MTKAQEIYEKTEALIASGTEKRAAFKQLAEEYGQPLDSIRGAYYGYKRKAAGGTAPVRSRRRETTPEDALASARAALERSLEAIDKEVIAAAARASEAKAEHDALKASAAARKAAITERLETLR